MTNHLKIVNDALFSLLSTKFRTVKVSDTFEPGFGKDEYVRMWCVNQEFVNGNHDGETRRYDYEIDIYFDMNVLTREKFDNVISDRLETLKQLLMESRTYQPSGVYKWHDSAIEAIQILKPEDENYKMVRYIHCEFSLMRYNQWSS